MARDRFNIYLPASGYNFLWQWGFLTALSEKASFWKRVNHLYGVSGGSVAITYLYTVVPRRRQEVFEWWGNHGGLPRTSEHYLKTGWGKFQDPGVNVSKKRSKFGISRLTLSGLQFEWKAVDPGSHEGYWTSIVSSHIPMVTVLPDRRLWQAGLDGALSLRKRHLTELSNCKLICASSLQYPRVSCHYFARQKGSHTFRFFIKTPAERFRQMFALGLEQGAEFLRTQ